MVSHQNISNFIKNICNSKLDIRRIILINLLGLYWIKSLWHVSSISLRQRASLKTGVTEKQSTPNFSKSEHLLLLDTSTFYLITDEVQNICGPFFPVFSKYTGKTCTNENCSWKLKLLIGIYLFLRTQKLTVRNQENIIYTWLNVWFDHFRDQHLSRDLCFRFETSGRLN